MEQDLHFTAIDMNTWKRREIFYYFSQMAPTGYSITSEIDVTHLRAVTREKSVKFFPAYLWLVTKALMEQDEFKIAVKDGVLGKYETLTPLYASFHEDDKTFSLMWTPFDAHFPVFYARYLHDQKTHGENHGVLAQKDMLPPPNAYTVSCLPWVSFTHFAVHSYENKPYYFPSVEAGKFCEREGHVYMPLSLTCHHAATDGYHVHQFLQTLQSSMDAFDPVLE